MSQENKSHPLAVGLHEFYKSGVSNLATLSNIVAIPLFWHLGSLYKNEGAMGYYKDADNFFMAHLLRTMITLTVLGSGMSAHNERLTAVGAAFFTSSVLDYAISIVYDTGIKKLNK